MVVSRHFTGRRPGSLACAMDLLLLVGVQIWDGPRMHLCKHSPSHTMQWYRRQWNWGLKAFLGECRHFELGKSQICSWLLFLLNTKPSSPIFLGFLSPCPLVPHFLYTLKKHLFTLCVCDCKCIIHCTHWDHRQCSGISFLFLQGIEFGVSGFEAEAFTCWAISPSTPFCFSHPIYCPLFPLSCLPINDSYGIGCLCPGEL